MTNWYRWFRSNLIALASMKHIPGNPNTQQRELIAGRAYVELDKKVIELSGADRLSWLNDMFSQKLDDLQPGEVSEALWLDVQGHILRDFHIVAMQDSLWLITFAAGVDELIAQLQRLVFRAKVNLYLRDELKVFASFNQEIPNSLASWKDNWPNTLPGGWRYGQQSTEPWHYFESVRELAPENLAPASLSALTALRVAAWRPAGPDEIDDKALPHEFDWLATAVHLQKGCYRGQETLAKVHNLGAPPRRLVFLHLDGSSHQLPEPGDQVKAEGVIGKITSVGQHYEMGPIALALIKRNAKSETVSVVLADGTEVPAAVEMIVPSDAGGVVDLGQFRAKRD